MHELSFTKAILSRVLAAADGERVARIKTIYLEAGPLSDIKEVWMNRYFRFISRGTLAEKAHIKIKRLPFRALCRGCGNVYQFSPPLKERPICPHCGKGDGRLLAPSDIVISRIEVE